MKTLDTYYISAIADATDNNLHTGALAILATVMGNSNMRTWCDWIDECHQFAGCMTPDLLADRALVNDKLMAQAEATYTNFNEIYAAF